jgi:hypothetical protein
LFLTIKIYKSNIPYQNRYRWVTVHFVARSFQKEPGEIPSETDVLNGVMEWKQRRKPPYDRSEVAKTIRNLASLGLISVRSSKDLPVAEEVFV